MKRVVLASRRRLRRREAALPTGGWGSNAATWRRSVRRWIGARAVEFRTRLPARVPSIGRWRWGIARAGIAAGLVVSSAAPALADQVHTVQPGESLSEVAAAYGVSLESIAAANAIADVDLIYVGADLVIPDDGLAAPPSRAAYRVQPGDTLDGIAATFDVSSAQLLAANPEIVDPDLIVAGQVLAIPGMDIGGLLARHAARYGLDPALVQALAWQESGWQQAPVSPAGAVGVMQLLPETAAWVSDDIVGAPLDVAGSASDNVEAGAALLSWLLDRAGSEELALAYYFQGQGSVARDGVQPATQRYVDSVLAIRRYIVRYGGPPGP